MCGAGAQLLLLRVAATNIGSALAPPACAVMQSNKRKAIRACDTVILIVAYGFAQRSYPGCRTYVRATGLYDSAVIVWGHSRLCVVGHGVTAGVGKVITVLHFGVSESRERHGHPVS